VGQIWLMKPFHPAREDILSIMKKQHVYSRRDFAGLVEGNISKRKHIT